MKNTILITVAVFAIALTSCIGPEGPMGPAGRDGESMNTYSTSITVRESDWILMGDPNGMNSYFVAINR